MKIYEIEWENEAGVGQQFYVISINVQSALERLSDYVKANHKEFIDGQPTYINLVSKQQTIIDERYI